MYIFSEFSKLIILLLVIAIVFLIFWRSRSKKKEGSETEDSR